MRYFDLVAFSSIQPYYRLLSLQATYLLLIRVNNVLLKANISD